VSIEYSTNRLQRFGGFYQLHDQPLMAEYTIKPIITATTASGSMKCQLSICKSHPTLDSASSAVMPAISTSANQRLGCGRRSQHDPDANCLADLYFKPLCSCFADHR